MTFDEVMEKAAAATATHYSASEQRKADAMAAEVAVRLRDEERYPERMRAARHHDVLCLVLKEFVRNDVAVSSRIGLTDPQKLVDGWALAASAVADALYPPPKAEP